MGVILSGIDLMDFTDRDRPAAAAPCGRRPRLDPSTNRNTRQSPAGFIGSAQESVKVRDLRGFLKNAVFGLA